MERGSLKIRGNKAVCLSLLEKYLKNAKNDPEPEGLLEGPILQKSVFSMLWSWSYNEQSLEFKVHNL